MDTFIYLQTRTTRIFGILGCHVPANRLIEELNYNSTRSKLHNKCSLIDLPGGVKALEKLRQEKQVLSYISEWD